MEKLKITDLTVSLRKIINAPIEKVFDAWLDAKTLSRFMTPMPGMPEPRVEADGKQGGGFTIYMQVGDQEIPHKGQYLEVKRPNKLVFTWESPFSCDGSNVSINFTAIDDLSTQVDFLHVKFADQQARDNHEGGWNEILDKLDQLLNAAEKQQAAV